MIHREFRSLAPYVRFEYVHVFNHRVTGIYEVPPSSLVFEGVINDEIGEQQEEVRTIHCVLSPKKPRPRSRFEYAPSYYQHKIK